MQVSKQIKSYTVLISSPKFIVHSCVPFVSTRRKNPSLTYKLTVSRKGKPQISWVVKFSPKAKQEDPWYDVSITTIEVIKLFIMYVSMFGYIV